VQDTLVILNPAARSERAGHWRSRVEKVARGAALRSTSRIGEAESLARNAAREGYQRIVAAGGDGTINEVVNGLAGTSAALGLLPIGTVNVFATELGLPSGDLNQCWQIICDGHTRTIDLPSANGKHSYNSPASGSTPGGEGNQRRLKTQLWPAQLSYFGGADCLPTAPAPRN